MSTNDAAQILTDNGWHFDNECFCGGAIKHVYKNGNGYEVQLFIKYFEFNIKHYNSTISTRKPYDHLEQAINSI
jgi:hypothetical protein